jgi:cytochrome c
MKNRLSMAILWAAACVSAQSNGLNAIHPGYTVANLQPSGATGDRFFVGGLDTFSDGRLAVCNWGNPGDVWLMANAATGTAATSQATLFATGFRQLLGCKVVHDTLYVLQMDELTQVVDVDKDGKADQYNKVNDNFSTSESDLAYAYDLEYLGGHFYAVLSSDVQIGGQDFSPSLPGRSVYVRLHRDNKTDALSTGFRNPNGMGKGFGNRLFSVDNQGSWLPSSKIIHLQEGKFYGHKNNATTPFQDQPETWPMAWLPHAEVSYNPGDLLFIKEGIYKNQFFFADLSEAWKGRIYRVSMQDVGGVMQAAVIPFSANFGVGSSRMAWGPKGVLYVGEIGSNAYWGALSTLKPGLKRITPPTDLDKSTAFEVLAVRSMGTNILELEFTEPVAADANLASKYAVKQWTFQPGVGYGVGNKANNTTLTVQSATIKADGKTVELRINGMLEKYLVHITMSGLSSSTAGALWTPQVWFTLNKFGPGIVPATAGCRDQTNPDYDPLATVDDPKACSPTGTTAIQTFASVGRESSGPLRYLGAGRIRLDLAADAPYTLTLADLAGREVKSWQGRGPADLDGAEYLKQGASRGIYFLRLRSGSRIWSQSLLYSL